MPLAPGTQFAGYTVERLLGTGDNGDVYVARHPRLPRDDALKILRPELSADPAYRAEFHRAADLAASLWHPHIVAVHDHGQHDDQLWIATDYVHGIDAAALLRDHYPTGMPTHEVIAIITAAADALDYAHHHGLLHRHVTPTNILLSQPQPASVPRILLSDFGIAPHPGQAGDPTATTLTLGNVSYSAPEQLLGHPFDGRADQYALAATAYHLLTGTTVFPGDNPVAVLGAHLTTPPPPLGRLHPHLSASDTVFTRALAKKPEQRFARCTDFANALAAALNTPQPTPLGSPAPPAPQQPTWSPSPPSEQTVIRAPTPGAAFPPSLPPAAPPTVPANRRRTRRTLVTLGAIAVVAAIAATGVWIANRTAAQHAAQDREAARLTGQHYLEALAAGDARTAVSLSAHQPATPQLLSDKALHTQLASTPITDIAATLDPNQDAHTPDTQRLLLSATFGPTRSHASIQAHKDHGQWKLDTTTITVTVDKPPNSDAAMKALAVSGNPTNGATQLSVFPGTLQVSSTNPYIDITAPATTLLLDALTTTNQPTIHPVIALNDAGRQASWAAVDARLHYCKNGGPPPPDCPPPKPPPPGVPVGDQPDPNTLKLLNMEKPPELTYDLDANTMVVHITGKAFYAAQGLYNGKPAPIHISGYVDDFVDITKQPPVVLEHRTGG